MSNVPQSGRVSASLNDGREQLLDERFKKPDHRFNSMIEILEGHFGKPARPSAALAKA